eukprot:TRINITY_DN10892_c0_g1_i4.p2 TRINITY_DN10892_c0_g1~~TRINITY_DN10892_c0_g1_i4.p2  ORF type:complete len:128 (-),score=25.22 TRINITY_DN10892_c0_g1_i4:178-561(-)
MQRGLVGSEMCIRDRYQRRVHGDAPDMVPAFRYTISGEYQQENVWYAYAYHALYFGKIDKDIKWQKIPVTTVPAYDHVSILTSLRNPKTFFYWFEKVSRDTSLWLTINSQVDEQSHIRVMGLSLIHI